MPPFAPADSPGPPHARRQLWATLAVLLLALAIPNLSASMQEGIAATLRRTVLAPFLGLQETLVSARARAVETTELRSQLDAVTVELLSRSTLEEENARLRSLLELSERVGPEWVSAQVLRPGTPDAESMLILDVGSEAGVGPRAPFITRDGLAGVVREVYGAQSVGMDWSHPDFRVSVMTLDGAQYGLVESRPGLFRGAERLLLTGVPFHAPVDSGTVVVTSGLGGVFPRGIPVGRVEQVAEAEGGWRKSFWLEPFVEVGSVTHVLVARGAAGSGDVARGWPELGPEPADSTPGSAGGGP